MNDWGASFEARALEAAAAALRETVPKPDLARGDSHRRKPHPQAGGKMTFEEWWAKTPPGQDRRPAAAWQAAWQSAAEAQREACAKKASEAGFGHYSPRVRRATIREVALVPCQAPEEK
jgi:hypothetical protein